MMMMVLLLLLLLLMILNYNVTHFVFRWLTVTLSPSAQDSGTM